MLVACSSDSKSASTTTSTVGGTTSTIAGYEQSVANLSQTSLHSDMVFSDGYERQLAMVTGTVEDGMTATLTVGV